MGYVTYDKGTGKPVYETKTCWFCDSCGDGLGDCCEVPHVELTIKSCWNEAKQPNLVEVLQPMNARARETGNREPTFGQGGSFMSLALCIPCAKKFGVVRETGEPK